MKNTLWIIYGLILALLTIFSLGIAVSTGTDVAATFIGAAVTSLYLTGLYGYLFHKAIWRRSVWKFLVGIIFLGIAAGIIGMFLLPTTENLIDGIFSIALSSPMIYALSQYSSPTNPSWSDTEIGRMASLLSSKLSSASEIKAAVVTENKHNKSKTNVSITNEQGDFTIKISKEENGETKSFINKFSKLSDLLIFLEANTPVRAVDFS